MPRARRPLTKRSFCLLLVPQLPRLQVDRWRVTIQRMKFDLRRGLAVLVLSACLPLTAFTSGCASVVLEPAVTRVERKNIVRITVEKAAMDMLEFQVENLSKEPIVVMKAGVVIETHFGTMRHPPGSTAKVYELPPGAKQKIAVKFTAKGLERGDQFLVHFDEAIRQHGQPVALDPIIFYVAHSRV